jgi:hypothetical protein
MRDPSTMIHFVLLAFPLLFFVTSVRLISRIMQATITAVVIVGRLRWLAVGCDGTKRNRIR